MKIITMFIIIDYCHVIITIIIVHCYSYYYNYYYYYCCCYYDDDDDDDDDHVSLANLSWLVVSTPLKNISQLG